MLQKKAIYNLLNILFAAVVHGSRSDLPKSIIAEGNFFRTAKMNFIWSKAIHHLSDKSILKAVKKELDRFDPLYLSAKERSLKSGRNDVEQVDRKLMETLRRFNLQDTVTAFNQKRKWRQDDDQRKRNTFIGSERFDDKKLNKLWEIALNGQFSEYQLKNIRKELKNYEKKEKEYHQLLHSYHNEPHENSLDGHDNKNRIELNQQLKNLSRQLTTDYDKLHTLVFGDPAGSFRNEEVDALWRMAVIDSNYSETELESIRQELAHFDKHMNRLRYHEQEFEIKLDAKTGKKDIVEEGLNEFESDLLRLKRKLKKFEKRLESRIRHSEL